jgi:hypothetical protein
MEKSQIIAALKAQLREKYQRAVEAIEAAAEAATGEDTKAESKYDTRGLEASYLAAGQVEQADRLARELRAVELFTFPVLNDRSKIVPGALVAGKIEGKSVYYLLAPGGGGITIESPSGESVTVLGSEAPLRSHLLDQKVGAKIERPPLEVTAIQ